MRRGFAIERLLCGVALSACSADRVEPARTASADLLRAGAGPVGPRFIGRFDQSEPAAPVFAWPGTAIALRFTGTAIGVTLSDSGDNVFEVVLDGKHTVLALQSGTKKY